MDVIFKVFFMSLEQDKTSVKFHSNENMKMDNLF